MSYTETGLPSWYSQKPTPQSGYAPALTQNQTPAAPTTTVPPPPSPVQQAPIPYAPGYDPYDPLHSGVDYAPGTGPLAAAPAAPAPAPAPPAPPLDPYSYDLNGVNPTSDLQYNAFLRGMGYDTTTARAQAAYQKQLLQQQLTTQVPLIHQQEQFGLTNAGEAAAARGAARSSSMLQAKDQVSNSAAQQIAQLQTGVANQGAQIDFGLQNALGQLQNQQAEQELAARQRLVDQENSRIAYQLAMRQLGY